MGFTVSHPTPKFGGYRGGQPLGDVNLLQVHRASGSLFGLLNYREFLRISQGLNAREELKSYLVNIRICVPIQEFKDLVHDTVPLVLRIFQIVH